MNSLLKALMMGAAAGVFHLVLMIAKGLNAYNIAAVYIQYLIGSVTVFHVPLKITGWKKGLAIATFCALPLLIMLFHYDPTISVISGAIMFGFLGSVVGMYSPADSGPFPVDRFIRAVVAGVITGAVHITILLLKNASIYTMSAVYLQYITACLLIFFVPIRLINWLKGAVVALFASMPLVILVTHYDPAGSFIAGFMLVAMLGGMVGIYSSYKE